MFTLATVFWTILSATAMHPFVVLVIELDDILVAALFRGYGGGFRRKLDKE